MSAVWSPASAGGGPRGDGPGQPLHRLPRRASRRAPPSSRADIRDAARVSSTPASTRSCTSPRCSQVGESVERPGEVLGQQRRRHPRPARRDARRRGPQAGVLLHRRDLRRTRRGPASPRSDPTMPTNPYGASKLAVDHMITGEAHAHGLAAVSLRYFNVAGAYRRRCGERHDPETHLIPLAAPGRRGQAGRSASSSATTTRPPDGTCVRDYIHVADLAEAHLLALDAAEPGEHPDLQPRQRHRLLGRRGHRGRPRGHRPPESRRGGTAPRRATRRCWSPPEPAR